MPLLFDLFGFVDSFNTVEGILAAVAALFLAGRAIYRKIVGTVVLTRKDVQELKDAAEDARRERDAALAGEQLAERREARTAEALVETQTQLTDTRAAVSNWMCESRRSHDRYLELEVKASQLRADLDKARGDATIAQREITSLNFKAAAREILVASLETEKAELEESGRLLTEKIQIMQLSAASIVSLAGGRAPYVPEVVPPCGFCAKEIEVEYFGQPLVYLGCPGCGQSHPGCATCRETPLNELPPCTACKPQCAHCGEKTDDGEMWKCSACDKDLEYVCAGDHCIQAAEHMCQDCKKLPCGYCGKLYDERDETRKILSPGTCASCGIDRLHCGCIDDPCVVCREEIAAAAAAEAARPKTPAPGTLRAPGGAVQGGMGGGVRGGVD